MHISANVKYVIYTYTSSRLASISQRRFLNVWMSFDPIFKLTSWGKEYDQALRVTHGFINKVNTYNFVNNTNTIIILISVRYLYRYRL